MTVLLPTCSLFIPSTEQKIVYDWKHTGITPWDKISHFLARRLAISLVGRLTGTVHYVIIHAPSLKRNSALESGNALRKLPTSTPDELYLYVA